MDFPRFLLLLLSLSLSFIVILERPQCYSTFLESLSQVARNLYGIFITARDFTNFFFYTSDKISNLFLFFSNVTSSATYIFAVKSISLLAHNARSHRFITTLLLHSVTVGL